VKGNASTACNRLGWAPTRAASIALAVVLALAVAGCLGLQTTGLDVTFENETDALATAHVVLKRASGDVVAERNVTLEPGAVTVLEDITRTDGRYLLNVTLDDGRSAEAVIIAGSSYGTPQVKVGHVNLLIFQKEDLPPRSL
jgi:hypothetical protein